MLRILSKLRHFHHPPLLPVCVQHVRLPDSLRPRCVHITSDVISRFAFAMPRRLRTDCASALFQFWSSLDRAIVQLLESSIKSGSPLALCSCLDLLTSCGILPRCRLSSLSRLRCLSAMCGKYEKNYALILNTNTGANLRHFNSVCLTFLWPCVFCNHRQVVSREPALARVEGTIRRG